MEWSGSDRRELQQGWVALVRLCLTSGERCDRTCSSESTLASLRACQCHPTPFPDTRTAVRNSNDSSTDETVIRASDGVFPPRRSTFLRRPFPGGAFHADVRSAAHADFQRDDVLPLRVRRGVGGAVWYDAGGGAGLP